jgi:hypothetical protein
LSYQLDGPPQGLFQSVRLKTTPGQTLEYIPNRPHPFRPGQDLGIQVAGSLIIAGSKEEVSFELDLANVSLAVTFIVSLDEPLNPEKRKSNKRKHRHNFLTKNVSL